MRTGAKFFALSAAFSAAIGLSYWLVAYERAGTSLLASMALAPLLVALFIFARTGGFGRTRGVPSPEDRSDARPGEGSGPIGSFPEATLWPVVLALGTALAAAGIIFGPWLFLLGALVMTASVIGLMRESRG